MAPSVRSAAIGRASVRQGTRASSIRYPHNTSVATRTDRTGAISPAESIASIATTATAGTKRKERDFEDDIGEETNINVVVRCRGRNDREVKENSAVVVTSDGVKGKAVELSMGPNALSNKTYTFDRVFSPAADQSMVFDDVVKPILDDVRITSYYHIYYTNLASRCLPDTTAQSSHMGRLVPERPTQCLVT